MANKSYSAINIIGLSLGISCGLIIFTLVAYHLSFDNFHHAKERVYRVVTEFHEDNTEYTPGSPQPLGLAFKNEYGFAEKMARVKTVRQAMISLPGEKEVKRFDEENNIAFADPSFFDIFNFPLAQGNKSKVLSEPNTAIITKNIALKYFGNENAVGRIIRYDYKTSYRITGVLQDIPANTDRTQQIYLSYLNLKDVDSAMARNDSWGRISSSLQCFFLLKKGVDADRVNYAFDQFSKKHLSPEDAKIQTFRLQPLADIHFNKDYDGSADKKTLWTFALVGLFLIVTACVNFVNLATALALTRAKEVGVRKVMGGLAHQLFWQFIAETAVLTLLAVGIGYGIALLSLPYLNVLFGIRTSLNLFSNSMLSVFLVTLSVSVVFLSGSYPGLVLSRFRPVTALKGKLSQRDIGGFPLRRLLVIAQFAISQIMIIGTLVIGSQVNFSKNADLGFAKNGIVLVPRPGDDLPKMKTLQAKLSQIPGVETISACQQPPASQSNHSTDIVFNNRPKKELWEINEKDADDQYIKTFGLKLVAGRNMFPADTAREFIVNEVVVKKLNFNSPQPIIGKQVSVGGRKGTVVGVVKNFYNASFRSDIAPIAITSSPRSYNYFAVKINMQNIRPTLRLLQQNWAAIYPEQIYSFQFLDDRIAKFYKQDTLMLDLIEIFSCIAILIGCLGLHGLISFMAARKTKEIGVRKVLGASVGSILWMFGKEFTTLLLIAFFIAAPVALWAMHNYLQEFKYRVSIGPFIFLTAVAVSFCVAGLTVMYRALKAAVANPVKSLRIE